MIVINDKKLCSGCSACFSICPVDSISMKEDNEGFLYPLVDIDTCIKCGKCVKVCPWSNPTQVMKDESDELSRCFATYIADEALRSVSSSGGLFAAFAKTILERNGIIYAVAFDESFEAYHKSADNYESLKPLIGSKYMQSRLGFTLRNVKDELHKGRDVLFVGTACQVAGLIAFLGKCYSKLICIDIICLGVPSPKIWREYLRTYFPEFAIQGVNFKDKSAGWHSFSLKIQGKEQVYCELGRSDPFFSGYFDGLYSRPSCSDCRFKGRNRVSDITISDCWGYDNIAPELDDNRGLSSVIVHSDNGLSLFESIKDKIVYKDGSILDIEKYNENYVVSKPFGLKRQQFWKDYQRLSLKRLFSLYCELSKGNRVTHQVILPRIIKMLHPSFWRHNKEAYKDVIEADRRFNETFRFGGNPMPRDFQKSPEWKCIVMYRKFQKNAGNIWCRYYRKKLHMYENITGIHFEDNPNIGKGLIIGHWGRIIINGDAKFGEQIFLTHGVTIGRDVRGRRKGSPTIGSRVCIRANSTIVGNIVIGDDVLIAPNSFVNFDVPSHSIVLGNPARIIHRDNATEGHLGVLS